MPNVLRDAKQQQQECGAQTQRDLIGTSSDPSRLRGVRDGVVLPERWTKVEISFAHAVGFLTVMVATTDLSDDRITVRAWATHHAIPTHAIVFASHTVRGERFAGVVIALVRHEARLNAAHVLRLAFQRVDVAVFPEVRLVTIVTK